MDITIGIDFDNTIVDYDQLIYQVALDRELIDRDVLRNKKDVRDAVRLGSGGDLEWQKIQALVYGPRILEAAPASGVLDFFRRCDAAGFRLYVVSHKTRFANYDETNTNLRSAAIGWMMKYVAVGHNADPISGQAMYFESTRRDKLSRISDLGCTHFIDDLEETFMEKHFPADVNKILFSSTNEANDKYGLQFSGDWYHITDYLFNND